MRTQSGDRTGIENFPAHRATLERTVPGSSVGGFGERGSPSGPSPAHPRAESRRRRHQEFIRFLKKIDMQTLSELDLHIIVDNYAIHKHPRVKSRLRRHRRFHLHFIPASSSWLNRMERWFHKITDTPSRQRDQNRDNHAQTMKTSG